MTKRTNRRAERGQVLVIAALAVAVVLAFSAIIVDAGFGYVNRRYQQNAADAASLAATRLLVGHETRGTAVYGEVDKYIRLNNGDPSLFQASYVNQTGASIGGVSNGGSVPAGAVGVLVTSRKNVAGFFSQFLDRRTFEVAARAQVVSREAEAPGSWSGLIPLAVPKEQFEQTPPSASLVWGPGYAKHYNDLYPGEYDLPSNWKGVLDYDTFSTHTVCNEGNKPKDAECWTKNGLDGSISLGAMVPTFGGDLGNNLSGALSYNIEQHGTFDPVRGEKYAIFFLVAYDAYDADTESLHVWKIPAFKLYASDVHGSSADGEFVAWVDPNGHQASNPSGLPQAPQLIKMVPPGVGLTPLPTTNPPAGTPTSTPQPTVVPATPTATPSPTATAICGVHLSGPNFSPDPKNKNKFDLSASWSTDLSADWTLSWGTSSSYGQNYSGSGTSGSHSWSNLDRGATYYWRLVCHRTGCADAVFEGTYLYP
jgi:hypothetical protein